MPPSFTLTFLNMLIFDPFTAFSNLANHLKPVDITTIFDIYSLPFVVAPWKKYHSSYCVFIKN